MLLQAELRDELVYDLAKRLRLARQRQEEVAVIDTSTAKGHTRMTDDLVAASEAHRVGADEEIDGVSAPSTRDGVVAARHGVRRVVAQLDCAHLAAVEGLRYRT